MMLSSAWNKDKNTKKAFILHLYRHCLKSAQRIPDTEQRLMYLAYTQHGFRSKSDLVPGGKEAVRIIRDAQEQLERMDYYHSIREAKETNLSSDTTDTTAIAQINSELNDGTSNANAATSTTTQTDCNDDNNQSSETVIKTWLLESLPTLNPDDLANYSDALLRDGFDSTALLEEELQEEDLVFMKKAHRRATARFYNLSPP